MNGTLINQLSRWKPDSPGTFFYKVTVNTTAGYFELPNIMNNQTVGPLLVNDPNDLCDSDCVLEGVNPSSIADI